MTVAPERPASLVGARVRRVNDPRLLRGEGRYVDDVHVAGMVHATIVRSPIAHGVLRTFDASACGALLALGPDEIAAATRPLQCVWLAEGQRQTEVLLGDRRVRYVGQPVGVVVALSRAAAEDAAELIELDYDELPTVADQEQALRDGAPLLQPEWGTNVAADFRVGDDAETVEAAMARAARVVERRLVIPRIVPSPMETRGVVASWDANLRELTVWSSTQTPHHVRDHLATSLRLSADQVRVIAPDLGGGFGSKEHLYPDEVMVSLASMRLGRPVKWIEDRVEHFTATMHARDAVHYARLGMDEDGRFVAIASDVIGNLGAHPSNVGTGPFRISGSMLPGPYRFSSAGVRVRGVLTNTTPTGAYRGFGMQEAAWVRERLVDEAARELGVDPVELRLMNMVREDELPHTTPTLQDYDSGDYVEGLSMLRDMVSKREVPSDANPRIRRGVGYGSQVEFTGLGPSPVQKIVGFHLGGFETGVVRVDPDGSVVVSSGVMGMGQGIETTLAQIAADKLGVPLEKVRVTLGDTKVAPYSASGSIASRSMTVGGGAVTRASIALSDKMRRIAAHQMEADAGDVELVDGVFRVKGVPSTGVAFGDVAASTWLGWDLPPGEEAGLEVKDMHEPANISYSYSSHAAAVAVDLDTGKVHIEGYWVTHDSGTVINPMIVDGQVMGGVAQGIGIALYEKMTYGEAAQPTTTSFLDYLVPLSGDVPDLVIGHTEHPAPHIPGGMKGAGEGGTIPAPATVANAVAAAVPEIAGKVLETPLSPGRMWELLHEAGLHDRL
ncbi:xanthine dehydrogenase family protein molybdopterin-binding subunit [Geodermatophilus sp. DF01-2]|uniref:xanthine dehydrogenase family protein molybdopterin-binding subunit n=1 Tax=Geodermatophilus sp. DF01-2 TaxID=2559610 RepID=UPI001073BF45|nr:xanthine dehydrogenase family protein molybdopterin-binding subunit [Geodermatophilus sp. DF01_2]TFV59819.1 xanthine dehydrogenase family protein molybdopterin-binding subunit [Geodermatophilus sp. DF01_2]